MRVYAVRVQCVSSLEQVQLSQGWALTSTGGARGGGGEEKMKFKPVTTIQF